MKKTGPTAYIRDTLGKMRALLFRYPVEFAVAVTALVTGCMMYEEVPILVSVATPHVFAFALMLNFLFRRGPGRWAYYLS